ncbi:MAG: hypothetical protein Q9195_008117 [Heterodermia aff. obscurata]
MAFRPPSRPTTQCTFQFLLPSLFSRSIVTRPSGNHPLRSPPQQSTPRNPLTNSPNRLPSPSSRSFSSRSSSPSRRPPPRDFNSPSTSSRKDSSRNDLIHSMGKELFEARQTSTALAALEITEAELDRRNLAAAIAKQNTRKWKAGDVYAPHDLSSVEMEKWRKKRPINADVFEALDLDPRKEYKNHSIMWEYVTNMGRIKHPRDTGLGNVSQRRLAKAIRRSRGMGLMPSVHNHPEVLETEAIRKHEITHSRR